MPYSTPIMPMSSRPDQPPGALLADVERYRALGWEWRIIVRVINRAYGTTYTARQLRAAAGE